MAFDQFSGGAPSGAPDSTPVSSDSGSSGIGTPGAAPAAPGSEQFFDVTINGQSQKVPLKELIGGYSRHSDYTRKTQELAARERTYQSQLSQYEAALQEVKNFLEDRARVEQFLKESFQQQQEAPDPEAPITAQTAQQMMQQYAQQLAQSQSQQVQQLQHQFQVQALTQQYTPTIDAKIKDLQGKHPALRSPRAERMLRLEVLSREPQSMDEALSALDDVAAAISGDLQNVFKQGAGQPGSTSPSPLQNRIEPPGGQGVMPSPQPNFKSVKDPGLRDLVMQDLMRSMNKG